MRVRARRIDVVVHVNANDMGNDLLNALIFGRRPVQSFDVQEHHPASAPGISQKFSSGKTWTHSVAP
jgi:hypothetical protein